MTQPEVNHVHNAEVTRVIDGDTFIARIELDFRVKIDITVRIRNYYAPELHQPGGYESKELLINALKLVNNKIVILSYKDKMSFERWICDVWISGTLYVNM